MSGAPAHVDNVHGAASSKIRASTDRRHQSKRWAHCKRARWRGAARLRPTTAPRATAFVESVSLEPMGVRSFLALVAGLLLARCSSTLEIATENISPISYQSYSCPELARTAQDLSSKASELSPAQGASWSRVTAVFGFRSENPDATRLAELKGQLKAIEQARVDKKC